MVADELCGSRKNPHPNCGVWRFMIDARYQRMGFGTKAMTLVVEHVRSHRGATLILTSYIPGNESADNFYLRFGFEPYSGSYVSPPGETTLVFDL